MYNIFRLTGRYPEAAFIRELFDEPASMLYQVWSLIRTIDEAGQAGSSIPREHVLTQTDKLIVSVVDVLEGAQETEIVRNLLRLRDTLAKETGTLGRSNEAETARTQVITIVNNFFYEKLTAYPDIQVFMDNFQKEDG